MTTSTAIGMPGAQPRSSGRFRLLAALAIDVVLLLGAIAAGVAAALLWLLTRTEAGLLDVTPRDGSLALAVSASALPAWTATQWRSLLRRGSTVGVTLAGLPGGMLPARPVRRALWLLLHPSAVMLWLWLGATAGLLHRADLAAGFATVGMVVLLLGAGSLVVLLVRPQAQPLHALLLGSRRVEAGTG